MFIYELPKVTCGGARCERQELIGQFTSKINAEREGTKYKPVSAKFIAAKLGHLKTSEIRDFYKVCGSRGEFGKVFFGALKVKTLDK